MTCEIHDLYMTSQVMYFTSHGFHKKTHAFDKREEFIAGRSHKLTSVHAFIITTKCLQEQ